MHKLFELFGEDSTPHLSRVRLAEEDPNQIRDVSQIHPGMVVEKVREDGGIEKMAVLAVGQTISADGSRLVDNPNTIMILYEPSPGEYLVPATRHLGDLGVRPYNAGTPQEWWNASTYLRVPPEIVF